MRWMLIVLVLLLGLMTIAADQGCSEPKPKPEAEPARQKTEAGSAVSDETRERFPDYHPKASPDTVLDYRPQLAARLGKLPAAELDLLPALLDSLTTLKKQAAEKPGRLEEGNVILGGDPRQYVPSDEEILASEAGERIRKLAPTATKEALAARGIEPATVEYHAITYRHVDVMGSGRYFYASEPVKTSVSLGK